MDISVITDNGLLKVYNLHKKKPIALFGKMKQAPEEVVTASFAWDQKHILQGFKSGQLDYWSFERGTIKAEEEGQEEQDICTGSVVRTLNYAEQIKGVCPMINGRLAVGNIRGRIDVRKFDIETGAAEELVTFNTSQNNLYCMRSDPLIETNVAVGMKEMEVSLYNVETQQRVWNARNLKNDFLGLRVPIWTTSMDFHSRDKLAVGTGQAQVRLYDCRTHKSQTSFNTVLGKSPIYAIKTTTLNEHILIAGDGSGQVGEYDLRTGRLSGKYAGATGGIRSIDIHPTLPLVAVAGLDRHVRIYNLKNRTLINKLYMKQKITSVLFSSEEPPRPKSSVSSKDVKRKRVEKTKREDRDDDEEDEEDEDEEEDEEEQGEVDFFNNGEIKEDSDDEDLIDSDELDEDEKGERMVNAYFVESQDLDIPDTQVGDNEAANLWKSLDKNSKLPPGYIAPEPKNINKKNNNKNNKKNTQDKKKPSTSTTAATPKSPSPAAAAPKSKPAAKAPTTTTTTSTSTTSPAPKKKIAVSALKKLKK
ncbi:WD40 repeat-containing protein [Cavenderia fasciculata]|uniref:WD40 repeat-containing protein n=1 Tax=Cavenderia fasciculata TaxID=261658 RepID=F4PGB4_CACFS|nr:WD40 repeat-containing protein [Cavenderia fasciculata]EGG24748.1 WD40 repeat-containing protein [Cavenderia fasciculata]|eukprot:XP_004362599.1 WD40 repeat-containing protein [Cavenderia fasciculata]